MRIKRLIFHVGGPAFHPVAQQARSIAQWLGDDFVCNLLVVMGLHWTGMNADWVGGLTYRPLNERQKQSFEDYVASGRPLLCHHGGIASYDDWPQFGELLGFTWKRGVTNHSPFGTYKVTVPLSDHPLVTDMHDYELDDELYYNVQITNGVTPTKLAYAVWEGQHLPMSWLSRGTSKRSGTFYLPGKRT
jgi:hypothetical protein